MKRAMDFGSFQKAKVMKWSRPDGQGEKWICKECQNVNWPLRWVCNNKMCNAPGPWTCASCNNKNFQGREFCNRQGCGLPRSASRGAMSAVNKMHMARIGKMQMNQIAKMPKMKTMGARFMTGAQQGSWKCKECQNVNWSLRTVCNNKSCGAPGPWTCPACQNENFQGRVVCNRSGCGQRKPHPKSFQAGMAVKSFKDGYSSARDGSWKCPACSNLNWALRTKCNRPTCGKWRPSTSSRQTRVANTGGNTRASGGSWTCPACSNVNWSLRTTCNRKGCNQKKPVR